MQSIRFVAVLSALLFSAMAIYTSPLDPGIPSIQLTFTEAAFNSILHRWNAAQIDVFKRHFLLDYPFLACYGSLGYLISRRTVLFARFSPHAQKLLSFSLPLAALADGVENALHLRLLYGAATVDQGQYLAAGMVATTKWLLILFYVAAAIHAKFKSER